MNYSWVPTTIHAPIPLNAVLAGYDSDGSRIFVGRTYFQGDQIPCKIIPAKAVAYISYNGTEHYVGNYFEILCGYGLRWISASHGLVPAGAIPAGYYATIDEYCATKKCSRCYETLHDVEFRKNGLNYAIIVSRPRTPRRPIWYGRTAERDIASLMNPITRMYPKPTQFQRAQRVKMERKQRWSTGDKERLALRNELKSTSYNRRGFPVTQKESLATMKNTVFFVFYGTGNGRSQEAENTNMQTFF
ncbi:hypothetical protein HA402_007443 [Bradysia odoriphaga]|nr:hypothetical protein HA402_007443 [Bradysia odoriphaga]